MAMTEDRKFLVVSHQDKHQVTIVDVLSGKVVATTKVNAPRSLLCRGNSVFVSSRGEATISVLSQVDEWKVIDRLNVPTTEVVYMSAARDHGFKDEILVTCHGKGSDASYQDCHNYIVDIRRNKCREIRKNSLATVSAAGLAVLTQKSFSLSPAGGLAGYEFGDFTGDSPLNEPTQRYDEENVPFVYQSINSGYWLSHQQVFTYKPIKKVFDDPKVLIVPDATQKVFYAVSDSQVRAIRLYPELPEVGMRPVRFEPALANGGALRNQTRRTQDYLLDHPVACTLDGRLTMFILAPDSGQVLRAQTTPFQDFSENPKTEPIGQQVAASEPNAQANTQANTQATNRSAADMIAQSEKSVVRIETTSDDGGGMGSGFVVDSKGTVITNCHVLAGATSAKAFFSDGRACDIVGTLLVDEARDIVVAKLSVTDRAAIGLATELPRKGEAVVGLGAPHGLAFTATRGIVSAIRPAGEMAKELAKPGLQGTWVQVDAALSPGNSGGPLVNESGQVVAMSTLASQGSAQNLNFGISAIDVREALKLSQGRQSMVLRESVANIRSKASGKKRSGGGGREGSSTEVSESAIQKYLADCRASYSSLTRDLRKEIERLSNTLKEMEKGETSIPTAISNVPEIAILQYTAPNGRVVWFFRSEAVKTRHIERTTARFKKLTKVRSQIKNPKDPETILQLAMNFGPALDARVNQSVGFVSDGTVFAAFNGHEVFVIIQEAAYMMWLESTAGLKQGEKILANPVFVDGTATVEVPDKGTRSLTVLRQVSEQEIRDVLEKESQAAPSPNTEKSSPEPEKKFRTWSDKSGKFSIEAQLVSSNDVTVKLQRRDGKTVEVPRAMLSEQDQKYLKSQ